MAWSMGICHWTVANQATGGWSPPIFQRLDTSQEMTEALQLQSRTMRSPRRCVPHQQSCLGHQLPCCDPCDTCYCRFFNAICYCRRVGQSCSHRHT
ncbi:unnamed protein product [Arctogadus glacialis]